MLIKVMTNRQTERLISDVSDVDIHSMAFFYRTEDQLDDTFSNGPGKFKETGEYPDNVLLYDQFSTGLDDQAGAIRDNKNHTTVRFVDYAKNGAWYRMAVLDHAYICNDEGRTLSKVKVDQPYPLVNDSSFVS